MGVGELPLGELGLEGGATLGLAEGVGLGRPEALGETTGLGVGLPLGAGLGGVLGGRLGATGVESGRGVMLALGSVPEGRPLLRSQPGKWGPGLCPSRSKSAKGSLIGSLLLR